MQIKLRASDVVVALSRIVSITSLECMMYELIMGFAQVATLGTRMGTLPVVIFNVWMLHSSNIWVLQYYAAQMFHNQDRRTW